MYKKVKLASIISTLILSATAYSAEMTVGFSQIGSESGWRAAETSVAKSEAQKRGIILKIADAQQKQENQIKAIRSFIAQGWMPSLLPPWYRLAGSRYCRRRKRPRSRSSCWIAISR
ncbi:hypothetical protein [Aeromonas caviae]|uniref:hypothetical protein n=1 Tax=Aeromonas caviae TaxID=648 RepID=UPI002B4792E0|nr:hypothetical protein [Aeromonas caviae]